mmetsp:Transcript_22203/g.40007  ORF Transcript_22203/g.40007 Transcript_22203/m.40007 type:complete len:225 (-) Transcript_22203:131-805(-)
MFHDECRVIHGSFAFFVQGFLAAMVLTTLLYKRYQEEPKRSWTVWLMDTSKQGFAMGLQHFVNIFLAVFFAQGRTSAGECIWYITNFFISVCCGLVILTFYMRLHRYLVERFELHWMRSGEYGEPPQLWIWAVQAVYWGLVCCLEKFIVAAVVILPLHGFIDASIAKLEKPLEPFPKLELVLVMVVGPTFMNAFFAWIVDNLIKDPQHASSGAGAEKTYGTIPH